MPLPTEPAKPYRRFIGSLIAHIPVERNTNTVVRVVLKSHTHITNKNLRFCVYRIHIKAKLFYRLFVGHKLLRRDRLPGKDQRYAIFGDTRPALEDHIIDPSFYLKKTRLTRIVAVTTNAKLKPVFLTTQCFIAKPKIITVDIKTRQWIYTTMVKLAVLVKMKIRLQKLDHRHSLSFANAVFQLVSAPKRPVNVLIFLDFFAGTLSTTQHIHF